MLSKLLIMQARLLVTLEYFVRKAITWMSNQLATRQVYVWEAVEPFLYQALGRVSERKNEQVKVTGPVPGHLVKVMGDKSGHTVHPLFCH